MLEGYEVVNPPSYPPSFPLARRNPPETAGEPVDGPSCPRCHGDGREMGQLGGLTWFRCGACGWEYSRQRNPFFAPPAIQYVSNAARPGMMINPYFAPPAVQYSSRVARPGMRVNPTLYGADRPFVPSGSPFSGMRNPPTACWFCGAPVTGDFCTQCWSAQAAEARLENPLETAWTGREADYVSPPGSYGVVGHSELAMHVRIAGKPVTRYALWRDGARVRWAQVEVGGHVYDGLPSEVLPDQVRRQVGWAQTNPLMGYAGAFGVGALVGASVMERISTLDDKKRMGLPTTSANPCACGGRGCRVCSPCRMCGGEGWQPVGGAEVRCQTCKATGVDPKRRKNPRPKKCAAGFHDYDPVTFVCRRRGCGTRRDEPGQTYAFGSDAQPPSFSQETMFGLDPTAERQARFAAEAEQRRLEEQARREEGQGGLFASNPQDLVGAAEAWGRARGVAIPKRHTAAWNGLYESWIKHGMQRNPLVGAYSKQAAGFIARKIRTLLKEKKPFKQAQAIAMNMARKAGLKLPPRLAKRRRGRKARR